MCRMRSDVAVEFLKGEGRKKKPLKNKICIVCTRDNFYILSEVLYDLHIYNYITSYIEINNILLTTFHSYSFITIN